MFGAGRVVEHDEQPPTAHRTAVRGGGAVHIDRNLRGRHAEGDEHHAERLQRPHRRRRRISAKVEIELPIREPGGRVMCPVERQRGLADAGCAGDDNDAGTASGGAGLDLVEPTHLITAPHERLGPYRQLRRDGPDGHRRRLVTRPGMTNRDGPLQRLVAGEQLAMHPLQVGGGFDAQIVGESLAQPPIRCQCLGLTSGPIVRQHQLAEEVLAEWVGCGERLQLLYDIAVSPEIQLGVDPPLPRAQPGLFELWDLPVEQAPEREHRRAVILATVPAPRPGSLPQPSSPLAGGPRGRAGTGP